MWWLAHSPFFPEDLSFLGLGQMNGCNGMLVTDIHVQDSDSQISCSVNYSEARMQEKTLITTDPSTTSSCWTRNTQMIFQYLFPLARIPPKRMSLTSPIIVLLSCPSPNASGKPGSSGHNQNVLKISTIRAIEDVHGLRRLWRPPELAMGSREAQDSLKSNFPRVSVGQARWSPEGIRESLLSLEPLFSGFQGVYQVAATALQQQCQSLTRDALQDPS